MAGIAPVGVWRDILRRGQVAFTVDGQPFSMAAHTAGAWIAALDTGDLEDVLPGLLPAEQHPAWIEMMWAPDRLWTRPLHQRIVRRVTGAAAGMPWTAVDVLIAVTAAQWHDINGWATERHLDLLGLPLHAFCDLIYHRVTANLADKDRFTVDTDLFAPTPDDDPDDDDAPPGWSTQETGAAFEQALAQFRATTGRPRPDRPATGPAVPCGRAPLC